MMKEKKEQNKKGPKKNTLWVGVRSLDGEMFPFPMTMEEHDYYLKLCEEEKKNSKK